MRYNRVAYDEFEQMRIAPEIKVVEYEFDDLDAGNDLRIPIEAGDIVLGVAHEVVVAFVGGAPAVSVGDSLAAEGYLAAVDLTPGTIGDYAMSLGSANAYGMGKAYIAGDQIIVAHAAGLTAGEGRVHILMYSRAGTWRQPDL